jgi:hypothetical protein
MPPKRRFRPPPQVLRNNGKMCEPAMLYLVISVLGLIMIVMQNTSSDVYCMGTYECERVSKPTAFIIQVFYIAFWTWLLNTLCKNGYKNISWIIVLFPFLLYAAAVFGLASSGVFHVREGFPPRKPKKKYVFLADENQKIPNTVKDGREGPVFYGDINESHYSNMAPGPTLVKLDGSHITPGKTKCDNRSFGRDPAVGPEYAKACYGLGEDWKGSVRLSHTH